MKKQLVPFLIGSLIHLGAIAFGFEAVQFITKPLLMISLLYYLGVEARTSQHSAKGLIITALVFSLTGDVLLMFSDSPEQGQLFFLAGLGSFLVTQICYAFSFSKFKKKNSVSGVNFRAYLLPGIFFILIMRTVWPTLPTDLLIPVTIYALAITAMVCSAMLLKGSIAEQAFLLVSIGSILFMCSDSLIAITKFTDKLAGLWKPSFWIMLTYILGQAGIIVGLTSILNKESK